MWHRDKTLTLEEGIFSIWFSWAPVWVLLIGLELSAQGQDIINHMVSNHSASVRFIAILCFLCAVSTFIATALIAAWHFPRVARVSMDRTPLFIPKFIPTIPRGIRRLNDEEKREVRQSAFRCTIIPLAIPLALLSLGAVHAIHFSWEAVIIFLLFFLSFIFLIKFFVFIAVRWLLFVMIAWSFYCFFVGLLGLVFLGIFPTDPSRTLTVEIVITLIAVFWLLIVFGFTFHVYRSRYVHDPSHNTWIPRFIVRHLLLLAVIAGFIIWSIFQDTPPTIPMKAADGTIHEARERLRLAPDAALQRFAELNRKNKHEPRPSVILISAAGGGIRAAYWSAAVLTALQDRNHDFDRHVLAISAVSGGALGATTYKALSLLDSPECSGSKGYRTCAAQFLSGDFIGPNIVASSTGEIVAYLSRGRLPLVTRDQALENAWSSQWSRVVATKDVSFSGSFDTLFQNRRTPALLLNGTSMVSGRRVITSNLDIPVFIPSTNIDLDNASECLVDREIINPSKYLDISASSAVLTSARFPYITPPGLLRLPRQNGNCREWEQIVDGGYIDNEGVLSLRDLLNYLIIANGGVPPDSGGGPAAEAIDKFKKSYRIIVIRLSAEPAPRQEEWGLPVRDEWNQLFSAFLHQRTAAGQDLVRDFKREVERSLEGCWVDVNAVEDDAPLGWTLSDFSRRKLDAWLDGPSSETWKNLHLGDAQGSDEALKTLAFKTNLPGRLQTILDYLKSERSSCTPPIVEDLASFW
jgi:hypothetical protein